MPYFFGDDEPDDSPLVDPLAAVRKVRRAQKNRFEAHPDAAPVDPVEAHPVRGEALRGKPAATKGQGVRASS